MKNFNPNQLERAIDLHEHVESERWEIWNAPSDVRRRQCEFWVFKARALLQETLGESDRQAFLWVLSVVTAIAERSGFYISGLSRKHHDDWSSRRHVAGARIRSCKGDSDSRYFGMDVLMTYHQSICKQGECCRHIRLLWEI